MLGHSFLLLILTPVILTTSCTFEATTEPAFTEIISQTRSNATPTWRGITPGETTEADFNLIVSGNPEAFEDLSQTHLRPEGIHYIWYDTEFQFPASVTFQENIVSYLDFGLPGGEFPFGNVIHIIGSPTAFLASPITDEFVDINLFYEEIGVAITFYAVFKPAEMISIKQNCQFPLTESSLIENVNIYFVEQNNSASMASTLFSGLILPDEILEPWTGEDVIRSTSGQTTLSNGDVVDCRYS